MVSTLHHDLFRAPVFSYRCSVVEHFVSGFDEQQIALGAHSAHDEFLPLPQVLFGEFVGLAAVKALLRAKVGAQADVRVDRRIDQHRAHVVLLRKPGRIESAERASD